MPSKRLSDSALRATGISVTAIAVGVLGAAMSPAAPQHEILLWVLAVIPAFLLAYHRGWMGVATVLAAVMAGLTAVQFGAAWIGADMVAHGPVLRLLLIAIGTTAGVGILAELAQTARVRADRLELTDRVTSLPNSRHVAQVLARDVAGAVRGRPLTLVVFQIDEISRYQLQEGRARADAVRRTFANVLRKQTRRMNFSGRHEDRFLTIVGSSNPEEARAFAEKIQSAFAAAVGPAQPHTVSAGVATYDASMAEPSALIRAADVALFQAQQASRNAVRVYEPQNRARQAEELINSMGRLRAAAQ
jgi:diguanylate cyclase (GGDEF)-like protein